MNLVNKKNSAFRFFKIGKYGFETLLKIAAIFSACKKRTQIECENRATDKRLGHFTLDNFLCQPFRDSRFANARLTDVERVVFSPATENLHGSRHLEIAPYQRVDLAGDSLLIEVHRKRRQRALEFIFGVVFFAFFRGREFLSYLSLTDAMGHVIHHIKSRHPLLAEKVDRMGIFLREDRD